MYKKGLALAIIVLFICVSFQPIIAEKTIYAEKTNQESNYKDYRNCRIRETPWFGCG